MRSVSVASPLCPVFSYLVTVTRILIANAADRPSLNEVMEIVNQHAQSGSADSALRDSWASLSKLSLGDSQIGEDPDVVQVKDGMVPSSNAE